MIKIKKLKNLIILLILQFLLITFSYSATIKRFEIKGNERISDETILMFSDLEIGDLITQNKLNEALKELYYTDYFKDIKISLDDNIVKIFVVENPIIQKIIVNGVNDRNLNEIIDGITSKINKYPLIESKVNDQVNLLKNI